MTFEYPPNFTRAEMLRSNTAIRRGIANTPESAEIEQNIANMAWFLQRLRNALSDHLGQPTPISVLSVYRNPAVNKAVGGSRTSAHLRGQAADIEVKGMANKQLAQFIQLRFGEEIDQIINEFPPDGWVHVGLADKPRKQLLTAVKFNGKTHYKVGLV
jgi:hypothetical protein